MLALTSAAAIAIGAFLGLPQVVRLVQERSSAGLSLLAWQTLFAVTLSWAVHGIVIASPTQIIPNGIGILECLAILLLTRRDRGLGWGRTFWLAALLALVAVSVRLVLGPLAFASFMVLPQGFAVLGQLVDLVRCRSIRGVSPLFLLLNALLQVAWIGYGLLLPDPAAVRTSSVMLVLGSLNVAWFVLRRVGVPALWPSAQLDVSDGDDALAVAPAREQA